MTEYKSNLTPNGDRVAVFRDAAEARTKGGLYVPSKAQGKAQRGTVIAVGPGRVVAGVGFVATTTKVGARVIFGKYSGQELTGDHERVCVMREDDILAFVGDAN